MGNRNPSVITESIENSENSESIARNFIVVYVIQSQTIGYQFLYKNKII